MFFAGALYPYDVIRSLRNGVEAAANAQWNALPNFLEGIEGSVLPLVDTSGSMTCYIAGSLDYVSDKKNQISCRDVAVSLGLYISERLNGPFKDHFMTFSHRPSLQRVTGSLSQRIRQMDTANWSGNTDLQASFKALLSFAQQHKVSAEDMPNTIVIFSDMQFDQCAINGQSVSAFDMIKAEYVKANYAIPNVVFWNLRASNNNTPVSINTVGAALVSGFSPSLMKGLFSNVPDEITPEQAFLKTIMVERYRIE